MKGKHKLRCVPDRFLLCNHISVFEDIKEFFAFNEFHGKVSESIVLEEPLVLNEVRMG